MCCIFTLCGWMLDLMQRAWIFFMTCCITTAVSCVLITASVSGIALGYNYSLAEYIDLRETNVSVYIKRGVFDDEIADDLEWRRAGHKPDISGMISDKNLRTGPPADETTTLKSGRRLDDSIYESGNQHQYEGSLLRLTAKPPPLLKSGELPFHPSPPHLIDSFTEPPNAGFSNAEHLYKLVSNYPEGSLDHLKAIQTIINSRRSGDSGSQNDQLVPPLPGNRPEQFIARRNQETRTTNKNDDHYNYLQTYPGFPGSGGAARRNMMSDSDRAMPSNIFRDAVPRGDLTVYARADGESEYRKRPMPDPPTIPPSPVRPPVLTEPRKKQTIAVAQPQVPTRVTQGRQTAQTKKDLDEDLDKYKQRLLMNQYDAPNAKADDFKYKKPADVEDYDEEIKGAPVRKKRSIENITEEKSSDTVLESHRVTNPSFSNSKLSTRTLNEEINIINKNKTSTMDAVARKGPPLKEKGKHAKEKKKNPCKNSKKGNNRPKRKKHKKRRQRQLIKDIIEKSNGQKTPRERIMHSTNPSTSLAGHNATTIKPKNVGNTTDVGNRESMNRTESFLKIMNHYKSKENVKRDNIAHSPEASKRKNLFNFLFW